MSMKLKLWGIRGSLPTPHPPQEYREILHHILNMYDQSRSKFKTPSAFLENLGPETVGGFGGHTSCVEIKSGENSLIIDGGSGIRRLAERLLLGRLGMGKGEAHILLTHFHWDHLIGLPFFVPIFIPGNTIHFYSPHTDLEENIRIMFRKPNFPVDFENLGAKIVFHTLKPRETTKFWDLNVTPYRLDHPDPCWGYRVEKNGRVYAHCVDSEMTRVSRADLADDLGLYQNVDIALMDAQYTFVEATEKINWGHASAPVGLDLAMREGIKQVLFVHHDPAASDVRIQELERQTREYYQIALKHSRQQNRPHHEVSWSFAREEQEFTL
jgi:phosphoribosyl 1,2-cyclic phosphodiesterase